MLEAGEGETDDVEIAAINAGDEAAGAALDGVGAGFVMGFAGREIADDFFMRESSELDQSGLRENNALGVGKADEGDAGDDGVGAAGKSFEHLTGVLRRTRLAEDVAFESDFGVGGNDDGGADGAGGDQLGFGDGQALDEVVSGFARVGRFVNGRREHGERNLRVAKNLGAANGSGSENQFHGDFRRGRILQRKRGDSLSRRPSGEEGVLGGG